MVGLGLSEYLPPRGTQGQLTLSVRTMFRLPCSHLQLKNKPTLSAIGYRFVMMITFCPAFLRFNSRITDGGHEMLYTTRINGSAKFPPMGYGILLIGQLALAWLASV